MVVHLCGIITEMLQKLVLATEALFGESTGVCAAIVCGSHLIYPRDSDVIILDMFVITSQ